MKRIIIGLLLSFGLFGQQGNSVYQTLLDSYAGAGTFTPIVRNIGQVSHRFLVKTSGCTGGTSTFDVYAGVSIVDSAIVSSVSIQPNDSANLVVNGLYPVVRGLITPGATCTVTVWYIGTLSAINPTILTSDISTPTNYTPLVGSDKGFYGLFTRSTTNAYTFKYEAANTTDTVLYDHTTYPAMVELKRLIVGTAGVTSSITIKYNGGPTIAVIDTTQVRTVDLEIPMASSAFDVTYTTTGGTPAKLTFVIGQIGAEKAFY